VEESGEAAVHEDFLKEPELTPWQQTLLDGYMLLHATRQSGFGGPQPIAISESFLLAEEFGCDKLAFVELVTVLDSEFFDHWTKQNGHHRHTRSRA
jgi:hypothetical protein